jgi:hypothetical protein
MKKVTKRLQKGYTLVTGCLVLILVEKEMGLQNCTSVFYF